jgi:catechol 2,3-dioxygenase-like lactoylglutathione lyase family enzyme
MIGYAMLGTNDLPRATGFYDALLPVIGAKPLFPTGNGMIYGVDAPALGITKPYDGQAATPGNGTMMALSAPDRAAVDAVHAKALSLGGTDEGAPGLRGDPSHGFYAAYFRDLDGNKLCVFKVGADH